MRDDILLIGTIVSLMLSGCGGSATATSVSAINTSAPAPHSNAPPTPVVATLECSQTGGVVEYPSVSAETSCSQALSDLTSSGMAVQSANLSPLKYGIRYVLDTATSAKPHDYILATCQPEPSSSDLVKIEGSANTSRILPSGTDCMADLGTAEQQGFSIRFAIGPGPDVDPALYFLAGCISGASDMPSLAYCLSQIPGPSNNALTEPAHMFYVMER